MPNKYEVIISKRQHLTISIWDSIEEYDDYDGLLKVLQTVGSDDAVRLYVSSPGGRCDIGFMLYDRISSLPCPIEVIVPYPAYSMGAILSLVGDSLEIQEGAYIMFHDYSTGTRGKGNEIHKQAEAYKEVFEHRFLKACRPFLTKKECEDILNGKDLYIKWNDPTLEARIKRHFK